MKKQSGICFRKRCNPQRCLTRAWVCCKHNQCIVCGLYTDNNGITRFSVFLLHVKKHTLGGVLVFLLFLKTKSVKPVINPYHKDHRTKVVQGVAHCPWTVLFRNGVGEGIRQWRVRETCRKSRPCPSQY